MTNAVKIEGNEADTNYYSFWGEEKCCEAGSKNSRRGSSMLARA